MTKSYEPRADAAHGPTVALGGRNICGVQQTYCFRNLIQLSWPRFYQLFKGRPVRGGDSGGWIRSPDANGMGWCGMIVGDDRLHGYAIYSAAIEDWWRRQRLTLSVV